MGFLLVQTFKINALLFLNPKMLLLHSKCRKIRNYQLASRKTKPHIFCRRYMNGSLKQGIRYYVFSEMLLQLLRWILLLLLLLLLVLVIVVVVGLWIPWHQLHLPVWFHAAVQSLLLPQPKSAIWRASKTLVLSRIQQLSSVLSSPTTGVLHWLLHAVLR